MQPRSERVFSTSKTNAELHIQHASDEKLKNVQPEHTSQQRGPYEITDADHPIALKYRPAFLAKGGEHLVYEIPDHPNVVAKISLPAVRDSLLAAKEMGVDPSSEDPAYLEQLRKNLAYRRELQRTLREHFGREHVAPSKFVLADIPLPEGINERLSKMTLDTHVRVEKTSIKSIVTIQPRLEELSRPDRLSLNVHNVIAGHAKELFHDPLYASQFDAATDPLMDAETSQACALDEEDFLETIDDASLDRLLGAASKDPELSDLLQDFTERCVRFANDTGEVLDFGKDNILFYKDSVASKWTYLIIDGLYGLQHHVFDVAHNVLRRNKDNQITSLESNALIQSIDFVRAVNGIAKLTGSRNFLSFIPAVNGEPQNVKSLLIDFAKRMRQD